MWLGVCFFVGPTTSWSCSPLRFPASSDLHPVVLAISLIQDRVQRDFCGRLTRGGCYLLSVNALELDFCGRLTRGGCYFLSVNASWPEKLFPSGGSLVTLAANVCLQHV